MLSVNSCKNDHEKFIPMKKFKIQDLPPSYQKKEVFQSIKSLSHLTVRVVVRAENRTDEKHKLGDGKKVGTESVWCVLSS